MDFIGKVCPYCKTEFKEGDDIVVCSVCEMPHHKECWIENSACTTFGCTGTIVGADQYTEGMNNKSFCTKCGAPLGADQKFCTKCGTPAGTTGGPHFQPAGGYTQPQQGYTPPQQTYTPPQQTYTPPQQTYTPPQQSYTPPQQSYTPPQQSYTTPQQTYTPPQPQGYTPPQQSGASQYGAYNNYGQPQTQMDSDTFTFIQKNQYAFGTRFDKMKTTNSKVSWNWCSFLFGAGWFAYRKMYALAAAFSGASLVASMIPGLGSILSVALWICSGLFGDYLYMQYINTELANARTMDEFNKNAYIAKKGGTSVGAVFALFGIVFVCTLIISSL